MPSVAAFLVGAKMSQNEEGHERESERNFLFNQFWDFHQSKSAFKADSAKFLRLVPLLRLRDHRDSPCLMEHETGLAVFCGMDLGLRVKV